MDTVSRVRVLDGDELIEERTCQLVRFRDGRRAAMWRGLAYALDDGGSIDVSGAGVPRSECLSDFALPGATDRPSWALVEGSEDAWVLIAGSVARRDAVAFALQRGGFRVLRSAGWLGEPVAGLDPDWYVRFERLPTDRDLPIEIARLLAKVLPSDAPIPTSSETDLRSQLLGSDLVQARGDIAQLVAEIVHLRREFAQSAERIDRLTVVEAALERTQQALRVLEDRQEAPLGTAPASTTPPILPQRLTRRLEDEVTTALAHLVPGIQLLRDSAAVVSAEFRDRAGFYRALGELRDSIDRLPPAWKKLKAVDGWWERHVGNGDDDAGRAYARRPVVGRWEVLVSHKGEQERDISWLRRQG